MALKKVCSKVNTTLSPPETDITLELIAGPSTPTRKAQKPGSKLEGSADDVLRFFLEADGKKKCKFCL